MDTDVTGVDLADSPPVPADPSAPTAPAPSTPAQPTAPEKLPPFHEHPRFQQLIGENRQLKSAVSDLTRQMQEIQQKSQSGQGVTPQERVQYQEAAAALRKVFGEDPELKSLLDIAKNAPHLLQGIQGVQSLTQSQRRAQVAQARSHVEQLARKENIPGLSNPKNLERLVKLVAQEAQTIPGASERFDSGDLSLLDEAFKAVASEWLGEMRRDATATVAQTKDNLRRLPPRPAGGQAGPEAPPKLEPGKEREFTQGLHERAAKLLGKQGA